MQRACLSGGTSNRSALAGGVPFFCRQNAWYVRKHCNLLHFWAQTASPNFLRYNFVAKVVTNKMSILGPVQQFFCDLTPSWVRTSGGKNRAKNAWFLNWGAQAQKCEKVFQSIVFVCMLSCQNTANTSVFGWFALGAGSHTTEENTGIYGTC